MKAEGFNAMALRHMAMVDEGCTVEERSDGSLLVHRNEAPSRVFLAQRPPGTPMGQTGGGWDTWTCAGWSCAARAPA